MVDSLLAQFLAVPWNILKKATLFATQSVIFSVCHKLLLQQFCKYNDFHTWKCVEKVHINIVDLSLVESVRIPYIKNYHHITSWKPAVRCAFDIQFSKTIFQPRCLTCATQFFQRKIIFMLYFVFKKKFSYKILCTNQYGDYCVYLFFYFSKSFMLNRMNEWLKINQSLEKA